jgi:hypothetical protein
LRFIRLFVLFLPLTAALADGPAPTAVAPTATATPAPAANAAPAPAAAAAVAPSGDSGQPNAAPAPSVNAAEAAAAHAELVKKGRLLGYRPVVKSGHTFYCRNEAPLGSRFEKTSCLNEDGLAQALQQSASMREDMTRPHNCGAAGCVAH